MSINKITESNILDSDTSTEFQFSLFIIVFFCLKVQSIKKIFFACCVTQSTKGGYGF